ncbi:MAG: dihydropteroate synthase [Hyphomicrobiaceae bacterium]
MRSDIYYRPVGFLAYRRPARQEEVEVRRRGPPAGLVGLDFSAYEVIERRGGGLLHVTAGNANDFYERDWGSATEPLFEAIERVYAERMPLAGLSLDRVRIMGIVNVTPDSFSDGGALPDAAAAIARALELEAEGADILDIGGESTRPGAAPVPLEEELRRVLPVIEGLAGRTNARLSIDTRKAEVMQRAAAAGADVVNDVSALTYDPAALETVAELERPVVLMHALGDPRTMQDDPRYDHVLLDVFDYLSARVAACEAAGIPRRRIVVDPGIGFGKTLEHNLELMAGVSIFHGLGCPLMIGASRKRFIGTLTGAAEPQARVFGSVAAALAAAAQGAQIVRVHDVAATRQALTVWEAATSGRMRERGPLSAIP